jgi:hypothetical protein
MLPCACTFIEIFFVNFSYICVHEESVTKGHLQQTPRNPVGGGGQLNQSNTQQHNNTKQKKAL